jgi:hypothetical protein
MLNCFFIYSSELSLGKSPDQAAEALCDLAYRLGSGDNITAVVVCFIHE